MYSFHAIISKMFPQSILFVVLLLCSLMCRGWSASSSEPAEPKIGCIEERGERFSALNMISMDLGTMLIMIFFLLGGMKMKKVTAASGSGSGVPTSLDMWSALIFLHRLSA